MRTTIKNTTSILLASLLVIMTGCATVHTPSWDKCTLSSNWHGANASQRMMNILSPHMPDSVFEARLNFIKSRGCNCVHVFVCNKADGEYAGYSIYGKGISWNIDKNYTSIMTKRIKKLRKEKLGVVLWLAADDSTDWNRALIGNFQKYVNDIKSLGWFDYASTVVLGLEMDEYWNANQAAVASAAVRNTYKGKIGTHMTSGKYNYVNVADILFYQTNPGKSASQIKSESQNIKARVNKPVNFFELSRQEDRALSQAALDGGAFAVGNW